MKTEAVNGFVSAVSKRASILTYSLQPIAYTLRRVTDAAAT